MKAPAPPKAAALEGAELGDGGVEPAVGELAVGGVEPAVGELAVGGVEPAVGGGDGPGDSVVEETTLTDSFWPPAQCPVKVHM